MTNKKIENLLVTGKTLAQSFLVNAATRLHPVEWSTGTATGITAGFMIKNNINNTIAAYWRIKEIQKEVSKFTPLCWTINGVCYPSSL